MDFTYSIQYLCCVLLWITNFGFINSSDNNKCHRVRTEFENKKIGSEHLVPINPIHDSGIKICFNGASDLTRLSCCNSQMEQQYVIAAQKYLKDSVHAKNAYLKKLIIDHISEFEERIFSLLISSENRTAILLQDIYTIPRTDYQNPVSEFFSLIKLFMKQKHISIYGVVATFFDSIFPSVYKYYLNNGTVTLTQQQENCLQSNRQEINPQPFGYIPYNISHSLNKALTNVKLYLEVLSLIVEAINSTDYANITEKCVHQVTKLQFCSHCDNKTNVKPCKGLCLNTMRRCLAQFSILHRDWNGLIVSVVQLGGGQSPTYKVETILKNLDYKIDEAITLAHTNSKHFLHRVREKCHIPKTDSSIQSGKALSQLLRSQLNPHRDRRAIGGDYLYDKIRLLMQELLTSMNMFNTVSDDICGQEILYDEDEQSSTCWNGTSVGRFTANIEDLKAFTSSEMAVDPKLRLMRDKLSAMRQTLDARQQEYDDSMMSDSTINYIGSGDNRQLNIGGGIRLESDDEDLNVSGSGSGDGSGLTETGVNVKIAPPKGINNGIGFTPERQKPPSDSAGCVNVSVLTVILTIVTTLLVLEIRFLSNVS